MKKNYIPLGARVKDPITGFTGIAISRTDWLFGCTRLCVKPERLSDKGETIEGHYFDEPQLLLLEEDAVNLNSRAVESKDSGGPALEREEQR